MTLTIPCLADRRGICKARWGRVNYGVFFRSAAGFNVCNIQIVSDASVANNLKTPVVLVLCCVACCSFHKLRVSLISFINTIAKSAGIKCTCKGRLLWVILEYVLTPDYNWLNSEKFWPQFSVHTRSGKRAFELFVTKFLTRDFQSFLMESLPCRDGRLSSEKRT